MRQGFTTTIPVNLHRVVDTTFDADDPNGVISTYTERANAEKAVSALNQGEQGRYAIVTTGGER